MTDPNSKEEQYPYSFKDCTHSGRYDADVCMGCGHTMYEIRYGGLSGDHEHTTVKVNVEESEVPKEECANCKYWSEDPSLCQFEHGTMPGLCKRHAPTRTLNGHTLFPEMLRTGWCGDFTLYEEEDWKD